MIRTPRYLAEWLFLLTLLLAFGGYLGYSQYRDYDELETHERERVKSLAEVLEKNLAHQVSSANRALEGVLVDLPFWLRQPDGIKEAKRRLDFVASSQPGIGAVLIVNADGKVIASNLDQLVGYDASQRPYFQNARNKHDPRTLYVTPPFLNAYGSISISLIREVAGPKGEFAGLVLAGLAPQYFEALLDSVRTTPDMRTFLLHGDGMVFMMMPYDKNIVGKAATSPDSFFSRHRNSGRMASVLTGSAGLTHDKRLIAMRTVQPARLSMDTPLVISVSRDIDAIFAPWHQSNRNQIGMFIGLTLLSVLYLALYQRGQRIADHRAEIQERALLATTDRLNEAQRVAQIGSWTLDLASGELVWSDEIFRLFEIDPNRFGATYEVFLNAIHPEDRDAVNQAYTQSLANHSPYGINHRLLMADGRIKWVTERCESEFDASGKPLRSMGTVQDISAQRLAEEELQASRQLMDSIVANIPTMVFLKTADDLRFELFNRAGEQLLGYSASDLLGKNDYDFFPREQADFFTARDRQVLAIHDAVDIPEEQITTAGGETRVLSTRKIALRDKDGKPTHLLGVSLDITERKRAEFELRIAAAAFESQESMMITDADSVIMRVNQAFTRTTGYGADEIVGQTPRLLQSGRHDKEFYRAMWETLRNTGVWQGEVWDRRKNGEVYPKWLTISAVKDETGSVTHYVGAHYDITERKMAEEIINDLAFFDQLTGLPNRTLLLDRLRQTMTASSRNGSYGALLFIDLDNFKALNDTLGHDMGDLLLKQVGQRLSSSVRAGDSVARLGGDEFVVMLAGLSKLEAEAASQTEFIGEKILTALNQPYPLNDVAYRSTPSIGATMFRGQETSVDDLLKQADLAMYKSKATGRNALSFFDPDMQRSVMKRVALETDLRRAVQEQQFLLYYQAKVKGDQQPTGAEVLLRWQHPERGMVPPGEFIPLAEETGLILPLGRWVLETACAQLALWASRPEMAHLSISVNVSVHQFRELDFVEQVLGVLNDCGADPRRLRLELTESLLASNMNEVSEKMLELKAWGVSFSLDDFGTGYSSLSYLKRLPLDQLKIDQSFVRDLLTDPNDAAIVKTIIALAENLGLGVIAEGVETQAQRDFLSAAGCHAYQGYFFSRPSPLHEFEAYVTKV